MYLKKYNLSIRLSEGEGKPDTKAGFKLSALKMTYASLIIAANQNYFRLYYVSGSESSILPVVCYVVCK
jgi:hypothetical protein